jgi:hypothetical protein
MKRTKRKEKNPSQKPWSETLVRNPGQVYMETPNETSDLSRHVRLGLVF